MARILTGAEHHAAAAEHHELAAGHHREAAKRFADKDYAHAGHQALMAHGHTQLAARHANEATKHHLTWHGNEQAETRDLVRDKAPAA
jgi:hypothetical protein